MFFIWSQRHWYGLLASSVCLFLFLFLHIFWSLLLCLAILLVFAIRLSKKPLLQNLILSLFVVVACLTVIEFGLFTYAHVTLQSQYEYSANYHRLDPELGYGPNAGIFRVRHILQSLFETHVAYDATYTITGDHIRYTPEVARESDCSVAFFGGSFTFGEGVDDTETMPYYFAEATNGIYAVYNFGFTGYGPHQMLRSMETGRFAQIVGDGVDTVVYQSIDDHVRRAAGLRTWDLTGPAYRLNAAGELLYVGPFHSTYFRTIDHTLTQSHLYRWVRSTLFHAQSTNKQDIERYVAILKAAQEFLQEKYGARFIVLHWDLNTTPDVTAAIKERLAEEDFEVILVSDIIPDINKNYSDYQLSPYNAHPHPETHERIGKFLGEYIGIEQCSAAQQ